MKTFVRQLLVFFFTLAVLEKAEVSVLPLIISKTELSKELIQKEAENTSSKESENSKEPSVKEYWPCSYAYQWDAPSSLHNLNLQVVEDQASLHLFYPPVPTPPPNRS
ncbi:hypothetical protein [Arcticibacter sp. MXS-1]|uniref:hypothetical protein n=1 Tax=Arcticibacter sp. MXS-1 TaxID=3341726 RepID=UPI0035A82D3E